MSKSSKTFVFGVAVGVVVCHVYNNSKQPKVGQ